MRCDGKVARSCDSGDVGVALGVRGNRGDKIVSGSTQIGGIHYGSHRVQLQDKYIGAGVCSRQVGVRVKTSPASVLGLYSARGGREAVGLHGTGYVEIA